jgi:hypothetical protein
MSVRLRFQSIQSDWKPSSATCIAQGSWTVFDGYATNVFRMGVDKAGDYTECTVTIPGNSAFRRQINFATVSYPLKAGTLSGTFTWQIYVRESTVSANQYQRVHAFVTQGETNNIRGTPVDQWWPNVEIPTTATCWGNVTGALSNNVACQAGDRLVICWGTEGDMTGFTGVTTSLWAGGTGADGVDGHTTPTSEVGWCEFSDPNGVIPIVDPSATGGNFLPFMAAMR